MLRILGIALLLITIAVVWQFLSNSTNNTDPTIVGHPLSNAHIHLHTLAFGDRPGTLYLGTHFGIFTSTDRGHSWPQAHGALNTMMITAIAASSSHPAALAVIAIPYSGIGTPSGVYVSTDGGNTWLARTPHVPLSAYPFTIQAGTINTGQFYAFFQFAGWFETRDMGRSWYPITNGTLSTMQTPSLLADPADANHLLLGGDQGLYESHTDGKHWNHLTSVTGNVLSLVASRTTPRTIFCASDQGLYRWQDSSHQMTHRVTNALTRLTTDTTGHILYGLSGQDLWFSADGGITWARRYHFDRGDFVSLLLDPQQPAHLYVGFFLPATVLASQDGGRSWQVLTA